MKYLVEQASDANKIVVEASKRISQAYKDAITKAGPSTDEGKRIKGAIAGFLALNNVPLNELRDFDSYAARIDSWLQSNRKGTLVGNVVSNDINFSRPVHLFDTEVKNSADAFKVAGVLGFVLACAGKDLSYVKAADINGFTDRACDCYPEEDRVHSRYPRYDEDYPELEPRKLQEYLSWTGFETDVDIINATAGRLYAASFHQFLRAAVTKGVSAEGVASYYLGECYSDGKDLYAESLYSGARVERKLVVAVDSSIYVASSRSANQVWEMIVAGFAKKPSSSITWWVDDILSSWRNDSHTQDFMAASRFLGFLEGVYDFAIPACDVVAMNMSKSWLEHMLGQAHNREEAYATTTTTVHLAHGGTLAENVYHLWTAVVHKLSVEAPVSVLEWKDGKPAEVGSFTLRLFNDKQAITEDLIPDAKVVKSPSDASLESYINCYTFTAEEVKK